MTRTKIILDNLKNDLSYIKPVYWQNKFERNIIEKNFGDVSTNTYFQEKFLRLIHGMDESSIQSIIRIILRQKSYLNTHDRILNFFTRKEQEELRLLKENFYDEIIQLSDDMYAYRHYILPINSFDASVFYYKHGIHKLNTVERVKGKTIIDIGGYVGDSVLVLAELQPRNIYTFEAEPNNYSMLQKTLELNHVQNVTAQNVALGEKEGYISLHVSGSCSTVIERPGPNYTEDITVPVIRLDDFVQKNRIDDIALIKVDIEGGEPGFLAGAKVTICKQKPILLLSIYHNFHDFFELKPMLESWNVGYRFSIYKPTLPNATGETLLLAEVVQ